MLDGRGDAGLLHAAHICHCHARAQDRVFGKTLEAATAERSPDDVDGRSEQHVDVPGAGLMTECKRQVVDKLLIPGRGEGDRTGQRGGWPSGIETRSAHAGRPIGNNDRPQAERALAVEPPAVGAGQQANLLLKAESTDQAGIVATYN